MNNTNNHGADSTANAMDLPTVEPKSTTSGGLPYKLTEHKRNWTIWFAFFIFDGCILPNVLFYALWYGSNLKHWISESKHLPPSK
jgi:hypothetical protein